MNDSKIMNRKQQNNLSPITVTICLAVSMCSCTSTLKQVGEDPFEKASNIRTVDLEKTQNTTTQSAGSNADLTNRNAVGLKNEATPSPEISRVSPEGITRISASIEQVVPLRLAVQFTPSQPRQAIQQMGYQQGESNQNSINQLAREYPDEYLFDGGDRSLPIHYDSFNRRGLDTEDTVVEYSDGKGKRHVMSTNRVAVFAPRFGAVRTISQPLTGVAVNKLAGTDLSTKGAGLKARQGTAMYLRRLQADGVRMRARASGLNGKATRIGFDQHIAVAKHAKNIQLFSDLAFLKTGRLNRTEEARLASRIQAARAWTRNRFPVIVGGLDAIKAVQATFMSQEVVGTDDSHKSPGRLRIVKLADKKSAKPGDIITFTIRYDNLGDRDLNHIRIVDNLTPRLEYVHDSATSDRAGRLVVQDNEEGSLILKFELLQPLKGQTGGVVTFKAKVR